MARPIIGITGNFGSKGCELAEGYYRSIVEAGGVPLIIPPHADLPTLEDTLDTLDALTLSGGGDLGDIPLRDKSELYLIRRAYERQIPMLGICYGEQMQAIALGGDFYDDIYECMPTRPYIEHSQKEPRHVATHDVRLLPDSLIRAILGADTIAVNSFHHQAVNHTGPHLRVTATSPDEVTEAIESNEYKSILGLQWHPEGFILNGDRTMMPIFEWLTAEARNYRQAVTLHQHIVTLDSHCDTPMKFHTTEERLTTLPRMKDGHLDATIMVAYLPQNENLEADPILTEVEQMIAENGEAVGLARTPQDIATLKASGRKAIMLGIENGKAIGQDISRISHFRQRGVVYMTLCHNGDNQICDSARGQRTHGGLSDFGREVIREMNRQGMMVDLSHASEESFWQALSLSATPIVCSHSSCRALCDHPRNLTDEQMRKLAERGGVMQVTLYHGFLRTDDGASILDAVDHIKHAVDVMGIEHVGIGTDFDGDGGVPGVAHAGELLNLTRRLLREGFSGSDLRLLWGGNFLRVMNECQNYKV